MTTGLPPNSRRVRLAAWLGRSGAALAGLAVGMLAAVATLFVFYSLPWWGLVSVLALFTLGPAIRLWRRRSRYRRGFAVGLAVSWVMVAVAAFVTLRDPGMTSEQLSRAESAHRHPHPDLLSGRGRRR
jgi:1,4-dihydroxy-2-naphthoate octaprenyltransferase